MNGVPTRIEMPKEGENILCFKNHKRQMNVPFIICADLEAILRKYIGCARGPDSKNKSYTEKVENHEACGYAYAVVRSDGEVVSENFFRGVNAVERFLSDILEEERKIRESLATPKLISLS